MKTRHSLMTMFILTAFALAANAMAQHQIRFTIGPVVPLPWKGRQ